MTIDNVEGPLRASMATILNVYGDRLLPSTGQHGGNISSQRIDELDQRSLELVRYLYDTGDRPLVLDIGGGDAAHSKRLALLGAIVILVDLTDQYSNVFSFNQSIGRKAIEFYRLDVRNFDFASLSSPIDVLYSQRMMSCIPYDDLKRLLSLSFTYSKEGAYCFVSAGGLETEVGANYPHRHRDVMDRWSVLSPDMACKHQIFAPECLYREHELADLLKSCGYRVERSWSSLFGSPKVIARKVSNK